MCQSPFVSPPRVQPQCGVSLQSPAASPSAPCVVKGSGQLALAVATKPHRAGKGGSGSLRAGVRGGLCEGGGAGGVQQCRRPVPLQPGDFLSSRWGRTGSSLGSGGAGRGHGHGFATGRSVCAAFLPLLQQSHTSRRVMNFFNKYILPSPPPFLFLLGENEKPATLGSLSWVRMETL